MFPQAEWELEQWEMSLEKEENVSKAKLFLKTLRGQRLGQDRENREKAKKIYRKKTQEKE